MEFFSFKISPPTFIGFSQVLPRNIVRIVGDNYQIIIELLIYILFYTKSAWLITLSVMSSACIYMPITQRNYCHQNFNF